VSLGGLLKNLVQSNQDHNITSSVLAFSPWNEVVAKTKLSTLGMIVSSLPALIQAQEQLEVIERIVNWDIYRAHLVIYDWFTVTGPFLVQNLVQLYQRSSDDLEQQFPSFSKLVALTVDYAKAVQRAGPKQKKIAKAMQPEHPVAPVVEYEDWVEIYNNHIPKSKPKHLPMIESASTDDSKLQEAAVECLLKFISHELIVGPLSKIDECWMSPQQRAAHNRDLQSKLKKASPADELEKVKARLISRGAILRCLVQIFGEYIFASHAVWDIAKSPSSLFSSIGIHEDVRLMRALLRDQDTTLHDFLEHLKDP